MYEVYQDVLVQKNTDYTISVDVDKYLKMSVRALTVQTSGEDKIPTGIVSGSGFDENIVNDSTYGYNNRRYSRTFNTGNYEAYRIIFYAWHYTTGEGFNTRCVINHPQLEKGNKATDWAPSPLDSQEEIDKKASQEVVDKIIEGGARNILKSTKFTSDNYDAIPSTDNFKDYSEYGWSYYNVSLNEEYASSGDMWSFVGADGKVYELYGYSLFLYNEKMSGSGMYYSNACMYQDVHLEKNTDYVFSTYTLSGNFPWVKCIVQAGYSGEQTVWDSRNFTWDSELIPTKYGSDLYRVSKTFNTGDYIGPFRIMIYGVANYDDDWPTENYISGVNYLQLEKGTTPTEWEEGYDALTMLQKQMASTIIKQNNLSRQLIESDYKLDVTTKAIQGYEDGNLFADSDWNLCHNYSRFLPTQSLSKLSEGRWVCDNTPAKESGWGDSAGSFQVSGKEYSTGMSDYIVFPIQKYNYNATDETHSAGDIKYLDGGIYQDVFFQNRQTTYTFSVLACEGTAGTNEGSGVFVDCKALDFNSSTSSYSIVPNTGFNIQEWEHFSGSKDWEVEYPINQIGVTRVYITFTPGNYSHYRFRIYGALYWESATTSITYRSVLNRFSLRRGDGTEYADRNWTRGEEYGLANLYYNSSIMGILNTFYPVGSYYETSDTTFNPNTAWGGIWILETAGMVHVSGAASGTYTVSGALTNTKDGGEATHVLTASETGIRNHTHTYSDYNTTYTAKTASRKPGTSTAVSYQTGLTAGGGATTRTSNNPASEQSGAAHNNMQPYIVVNRWHRTA